MSWELLSHIHCTKYFLRIWSHLQKESLIENFTSSTVTSVPTYPLKVVQKMYSRTPANIYMVLTRCLYDLDLFSIRLLECVLDEFW